MVWASGGSVQVLFCGMPSLLPPCNLVEEKAQLPGSQETWSQLQLYPQVAAQLWTSHLSSPGLTLRRGFQHQGSPWPGSSSLGSADVMCCGHKGMFAPRSSWEAPGAFPLDLCLLILAMMTQPLLQSQGSEWASQGTVSSPGPQAAVYPKTELSLISQEWPKQGFHSCPHMDPKKPTGTSEEAKLPIHGAFKASTLLTRNLRAGGTRMGNCVVPESLAGEFLSISLCSTALPTCLHLPLGTGESWPGRDLQSHLVHPLSLQIQKLSLERGTHSPRANSCLRGNSHQW